MDWKSEAVGRMKDYGKMVLVSNNVTHICQLLDLKVNRSYKAFFHQESQNWFAEQVQHHIQSGWEVEYVKVVFGIIILRPIKPQWWTSFYDPVQKRPDIAVKGFKRPRISDFFAKDRQHEDSFMYQNILSQKKRPEI